MFYLPWGVMPRPVRCAALLLNVPVVLHEANVLPGRAVRLFSRWAATVAGSFEETRFYLRRKDLIVTGMPIRKDLEKAARNYRPHESGRDVFTVLVMGGSRGAHRLNDVASAAIAQIHKAGHRIRVIHLAGFADEAAIRRVYENAGVPGTISGFAQDMASVYAAADLAICRSGAATCAELSAFAVPALLIPYPFAANDHQTVNARAMEKSNAADVVPERDLSISWLVDYIVRCMQAPGRLARMSAASRSRAMQSAAELLAEVVIKVGRGDYGVAV
jgi:UDP-N-acetylglucosamine--N-acetylmuramyl-(pentapeptide) pyrophosphoryl-undecaprenol N-acetylglucosamine transferase